MNKHFHNLILGVSILPALLIMPAIAADPVTEGYAWVFGDVTIPAGQPIDLMGFGGRRMSAPEHMVNGMYRNDFPAYNMLGQSLTVTAGNGESLSPLYVGPVNLTLKKLTDENFKYNYQWWNDEHNDPESDIDLAAAPAKLNLTEEQLAALGLESPLTSIGWNDEDAVAKVAAVIGPGNAEGTAGGVVLFSHKDSDTTNDGVLSLGKTNAVIDGATVNATTVNVTNSKLQFSKQDTSLFKASNGTWYTSVWYTNPENISSTGVTTLNAKTINIDGSTLEVKPEAKLVINNETPDGATTIKNVSSAYGALTANGNGSILLGGDSLVFDNNTSSSHGAALYFKDQTAGNNAARLIANNITFSNNTSDYSSVSGGAVFSSGGNMSILGTTNTFTGNSVTGTDVSKSHKRGGGAVANQSYEVESSWASALSTTKGNPIDATMIIGKENGSSTNLFENNSSSMNGGAVMNRAVDTDGNAYLTINGTTTFNENTATMNGGAIYNFADAGKIAEVYLNNGTYTFTGNTAQNGGAIYSSGKITIDGATFESNEATGNYVKTDAIDFKGGGAITLNGLNAYADIKNTTFKNNVATGSDSLAGALYVFSGTARITNSVFDGNSAVYGGAIYTRNKTATSDLLISNTEFKNNHADEVGAVTVIRSANISDTTFKDNRATSTAANSDGAGALFLGSESLTRLSNVKFEGNESGASGGAIATRKSSGNNNSAAKLNIIGGSFIENTAATNGGAIDNTLYNDADDEGYVSIVGTLFKTNQAQNGGAIYNHSELDKVGNMASMRLTGATFTNNIATTNGGAIYNAGNLELVGANRFAGNKANGVANDIHNTGTLSIVSGTTTLDGGITGDGTLTIADGAILNIGKATITQGTINLGGTLIAELVGGADPIFNATTFTNLGNKGKLSLSIEREGTYNLFSNAAFDKAQEQVTSSVYDLDWDSIDGSVIATKKTVEQIVEDTGLETESASTLSHIADAAAVESASKQMRELSLKLQEKLAEAATNPDAKAEVEHATKAIHPEKEAVAQSIASSVQNTVVNLASSRMATPRMGRNGGDVKLTSGGFWFQGLFNKSKQNDAFTGNTRGIALGLDGTLNKRWTIGAGYSTSNSDITGTARDTKITSNTAFLYGQYKPAAWYLNAIANYTWSDYSEKGTVIDNRTIFGDYSVNSFGGALATGYDFKNGITPELGLRYMRVMASDYANSYGVKTHLDDANYLTGVLGGRYTFKVAATKHTVFMPQLNAGVKYDLLSDKKLATVTMPGVDSYTLEGKRLSRIGGEFGIGLGMQYHNLEISAIYDIDVRESYTSQTGMLKFRSNF